MSVSVIKTTQLKDKEVGDLFLCKICEGLSIEPQECLKCGMIYCLSCIER